MRRSAALLGCALALAAAAPPSEGESGRPVQPAAQWERAGGDLLRNFRNMYQPCVVERPGEEYPYRMWFFGWAAADTNPGVSGCDAVYHARSKDLEAWEVLAVDGSWDTEMRPERWRPVLSAGDRFYDAWHNGDPSVVWHDGKYHMAYSATSKPRHKQTLEHLDGMLLCVMGATSPDGVHWEKTASPLLMESGEAMAAPVGDGFPKDFHRPCLMRDGGAWRLWFDYWCPPHGLCLGHAENTGDFHGEGGFRVTHDLREPLLINWPNPDVVRVGRRYHAFGDPSGFPPTDVSSAEARAWSTRQLCEAVSDDGLHWRVAGYLPPDPDTPACHVPQALVTVRGDTEWMYLFYAAQRGGGPPYDYRYDRIRARRRPVAELVSP